MSNYQRGERVTVQINGRTVSATVITPPPGGKSRVHTVQTADGRAYDVELPVKEKDKAPA